MKIKLIDLLKQQGVKVPENNECPACKNSMIFNKSTFEQYEPSVFWCNTCELSYSIMEIEMVKKQNADWSNIEVEVTENLEPLDEYAIHHALHGHALNNGDTSFDGVSKMICDKFGQRKEKSK